MNGNKFLGICIVLSSILVSAAILYHASTLKSTLTSDKPEIGRYQFHPSNPPGVIWKMDTVTGNITTRSG
jgi:hypothetical protein